MKSLTATSTRSPEYALSKFILLTVFEFLDTATLCTRAALLDRNLRKALPNAPLAGTHDTGSRCLHFDVAKLVVFA